MQIDVTRQNNTSDCADKGLLKKQENFLRCQTTSLTARKLTLWKGDGNVLICRFVLHALLSFSLKYSTEGKPYSVCSQMVVKSTKKSVDICATSEKHVGNHFHKWTLKLTGKTTTWYVHHHKHCVWLFSVVQCNYVLNTAISTEAGRAGQKLFWVIMY